MNKYQIAVQRASTVASIPKNKELKQWAIAALSAKIDEAEVTIRIVDVSEMTELNTRYRHKQGPTNVLSFPFDIPPLLGDIIICAEVVQREANEQHKSLEAHWAHMVVHGVLHLLGYDHEIENDALKMEAEEIIILSGLNFPNPYQIAK